MTVKVKLRKDLKATVRFSNPHEASWFRARMIMLRDSNPKTHPQMVVRDDDGKHSPPLPKPKSTPIVVGDAKPVPPPVPVVSK